MCSAGKLGRGLLLHFWADIDSNPTIMGIVRGLVAAGFELDVCFETRDFLLAPSFPSPGVVPFRVGSWRDCRREMEEFVRRRVRERPYAFVIAVDIQGLSVVDPLLEILQCPLVYLSLEITFRDEMEDPEDVRLKEEEIRISRQADLVIVQDPHRGDLLARENGLSPARFVYLPNAPSGPATTRKSDFLHRHLGIPPEKKIVLHAGSFAPWTFGEELCQAAHDWDEEFLLVVHTRHRSDGDPFLDRIRAACDPKRVRFSTTPLPFDTYGELIASSDIGLVLYQPAPSKFTQKNIIHIGLSSGKFSYFLRHGKPVVTNGLSTYRRIVREHDIGCVVDDIVQIGAALRFLDEVGKNMAENCNQFFNDHLDFHENFPDVLRALMRTAAGILTSHRPGDLHDDGQQEGQGRRRVWEALW